eukprot:s364_g30.t1
MGRGADFTPFIGISLALEKVVGDTRPQGAHIPAQPAQKLFVRSKRRISSIVGALMPFGTRPTAFEMYFSLSRL